MTRTERDKRLTANAARIAELEKQVNELESEADAHEEGLAAQEELGEHFAALCRELDTQIGFGRLPVGLRMQFEAVAEQLGVPGLGVRCVTERSQLFPYLPAAGPPRDGYAVKPVGRKGSRRKSAAARTRQPPPAVLLLAELQRVAPLLAGIGPLLQRIECELAKSAGERRQTNELVGRLTRQHVELRRTLGATALHVPPRYSRRRPLGAE